MIKSIQMLSIRQARPTPTLFFVTGVFLLLCFSNAMGQAGSKESQKLLEYSQGARDALTAMKKEVGSAMDLYNTLIAAEAKKSESTYKKLTQAISKSEKAADKSGSSIEKMQKQAKKVYSAWEKELEGYENEQLKELGVQRLDASRQTNDAMAEKMKSVGEAYNSFISSLNDQVKFMARDLSPDAMSALQGVAQELNVMAEDLFAQIDAALAEEQLDEAGLVDQGG